jgi:RES domain-containing protein
VKIVSRSGTYWRVVDPDWVDPTDSSYSKTHGGRWNPPGEFGALYLNGSIRVAAANARARFEHRAVKLFDLTAEFRPQLVTFDLPPVELVDAASDEGIADLGLPPNFPYGVPWEPCQSIAREARETQLDGVTSRSNAEATPTFTVGEEVALFASGRVLKPLERRSFADWYPDPIPG